MNNQTESNKLISTAIDIILEEILTPIIYMYCDEIFEFIIFCDNNIPNELFINTQKKITNSIGILAEIIDIREFSTSERTDIVSTAQLVYAENDLIVQLFEKAMYTDLNKILKNNQDSLKRKHETGTYYLN